MILANALECEAMHPKETMHRNLYTLISYRVCIRRATFLGKADLSGQVGCLRG